MSRTDKLKYIEERLLMARHSGERITREQLQEELNEKFGTGVNPQDISDIRKELNKKSASGLTEDLKGSIDILINLFNEAAKKLPRFLDLLGEDQFNAMKTLQGAIQ